MISASRAGESADREKPAGLPGRAAHVPLFLVAASLVSLAVVQVVIQGRIAVYLDDIANLVEPARKEVSDLQISLALEAAGTRAFLLTGDQQYARNHQEARAARRRSCARLMDLSPRFAPEVGATLTDLHRVLEPADALLDGLYGGKLRREDYMASLPAQQTRFQAVTAATRRLHDLITREATVRREAVRAAQRLGTILIVAGVLLTMAAIASVARLSMKHLSLAEQERTARAATEKAHQEAELRRLELEHVTASRQRLIRGFSHDLKNPLGAADGHLFMLEGGVVGPLSEAQRDYVRKSRRSVETAVQLIESLLELARAERGDIALNPRVVDLRDIAGRIVEDYRAQAEGKGLTIATDFPSVPPAVTSDPQRIGQILGNLVGNAIKYTAAGSITVRVGERADRNGTTWAVVDVSDTGPGVPEQHQRAIFQEFHRLDTSADATGAGIGLAISQRIAVALGGSITVESEPGHGATFTLRLPLDAGAAPSPRAAT